MSDYLAWCEQMRYLPLGMSGDKLESANAIKVVGIGVPPTLLKIIRPEVVYVRRLKILGEVAYSLLDYHLNPAERVTPNVCPISGDTLWRQFVQGREGQIWRGELYAELKNLHAADLAIVGKILGDRSTQRIALLDFIFVSQDRSARNWVIDGDGNFWAIDNGMFWPYKGRHADKETARTGKVDHLNHPMEALIPASDGSFCFQVGVFSSLLSGWPINDGLVAWLYQVDWRQYLKELNGLIGVLGYPYDLTDDWRFAMLEARANWLIDKRRFPTAEEANGDVWQSLIDRPDGSKEIWRLEWEL